MIESGEYVRAEEELREALRAAPTLTSLESAKLHKLLAEALASQGRQKHQEAMSHLEQAEGILRIVENADKPDAAYELGRVYLVKAQTLCVDAVRQLREFRLSGTERTTFFSILQGNLAPATEALDVAERLYPAELRADVCLVRADLAKLSLDLNRLFVPEADHAQAYSAVRDSYRNAINLEQQRSDDQRGDVVVSAWIGIGSSFREEARLNVGGVSTGLLNRASTAFSSALECPTKHRELALTAAIGKARTVLDAGKRLDAQMTAELEELLLQTAQSYENMRAEQSKGSTFSAAQSFFSTRTAAYEVLVLLYENAGDSRKMFGAMEQMKARALRDLMRDSASEDEENEDPVNFGILAKKLRSQNAALLEFFHGPEHAWAFLLLPDGTLEARSLGIGGQELTRKMSLVLRGFSNQGILRLHLRRARRGGAHPAVTDAYAAAQELFDLLMRPTMRRLHASNIELLYIVPHHLMHYLPFQALVSDRNDENLFMSKYFIEDGPALSYLPSAASLLNLHSGHGAKGALVFARSDFTTQSPKYGSDLPNAVPEARTIASILGTEPFLESDASEAAFREHIGSHGVLYFATHGDLDRRNPMESALLLAETPGRKGHDHDGRVTVQELLEDMKGKLKVDLVVMSACHTNRGEPNPLSGDDLSNLSRAFLAAGARSIIATQWEASDDTFPKLMSLFFRQLGTPGDMKKGKAEALRNAVREFLNGENLGVYRHPIFWAPVVVVGDGR